MSEDALPKLPKLNKQALREQFLTWVNRQTAGSAAEWFNRLAEPEQHKAIRELAAFCDDAGFDLAWVTQDAIKNDSLRATLQAAVLHHLNALHQASAAQATLALYKQLVAWLQDPSARRQRAQTRKVYALLAAEGVVPPASADTLLASDKNRWIYVRNALLEAYGRNPAAVERAVSRIMLTPDQTPAGAAPTPVPV